MVRQLSDTWAVTVSGAGSFATWAVVLPMSRLWPESEE